MAKAKAANHRVGMRELRQNLSVHLGRVKRGERLEVTEHGKAVALLVPMPTTDSVLERLIAEGRATQPQGDLLALGLPPTRPEGAPTLGLYVEDLRQDRL